MVYHQWPVGQAVKTSPSHGENRSSILLRVTIFLIIIGVDSKEVPPVPIPNTVVKLIRAEDTWRATAWKNRSVPT